MGCAIVLVWIGLVTIMMVSICGLSADVGCSIRAGYPTTGAQVDCGGAAYGQQTLLF